MPSIMAILKISVYKYMSWSNLTAHVLLLGLNEFSRYFLERGETMGKNEDIDVTLVPPLYVTPVSYILSRQHTILMIKDLLKTCTKFKQWEKKGFIQDINSLDIDDVIKSIIDQEVVIKGQSLLRFDICKLVLDQLYERLGRKGEDN